PAAADVRHRFLDIAVSRFRLVLEQRGGSHDLAALTVAALRYVQLSPSLLDRMIAIGAKALDGDDRLVDVTHPHPAGAGGDTIELNRAGAALLDAAAIFGASQTDDVADDP